MVHQHTSFSPADTSAGTRLCCTLRCGVAALERPLISVLEAVGLPHATTASTLLLLDLPCGFAWQSHPLLEQTRGSVVILTFNPCPDYLEDLWDLKPAGLVAKPTFDHTLVPLFQRVAAGERVRLTPPPRSTLTATERAILRAVARGWDNQRIARAYHLEEKTVRNVLTRVYSKLPVTNRVQAALYYWGRAAPDA